MTSLSRSGHETHGSSPAGYADTLSASVVVPTYRRAARLPELLDRLLADPATHEVIVVVDGCRDGSLELLQQRAAADSRVMAVWQENAGANAARETGLRHAGGDVVVFLDDDVVPSPGLITGHVRAHEATPHAVVAGYMPTALPAHRRAGQFATYLYRAEYEQMCAEYDRDRRTVLLNMWFGNVSMRRDDVCRIGLSAPGAPIYHEDKEFGFRCRAAGLTPLFDRSLRAEHWHHRSLDGFIHDTHLQAEGRRILRERYADTAAAADLTRRFSPGIRAMLAVLSHNTIHPAASRMLITLVKITGRCRLWPVETAAARVLRQVEMARSDRRMFAQHVTPLPRSRRRRT